MANVQGGIGGAGSGAATGFAVGGPVGAAIGGGIGLLAGLFGGGDSAQEEANRIRQQILEEMAGVPLPTIEEQQVKYEEFKSQGRIKPEMEQFVSLDPSQMSKISTNPRLREAQLGALTKMRQVGQEGLTPEDRMAMGEIQRETEREAQARNESILQRGQQTGTSGAGAERAAQLISSQAQAERSQQGGQNIASQASQRALDAILKRAGLAGQMEEQQFGQASQVASAEDAINRANTANKQQVMNQNVALRNQAQADNLAQDQRIANANVEKRNAEQDTNKRLYQQNFENQMRHAGAEASAMGRQASAADAAANRADAAHASFMSGLGTAGDAVAQRYGAPTAAEQAELDYKKAQTNWLNSQPKKS
jgi:hypothetical protein